MSQQENEWDMEEFFTQGVLAKIELMECAANTHLPSMSDRESGWNDEEEVFTQRVLDMVDVVESIANTTAVKMMSFNVQNLRTHSAHIIADQVFSVMDYLAFTETSWKKTETLPDLPEFVCVASSKRSDAASAGVAVYQRSTATIMAIPHAINKLSESYDAELGLSDGYGDICAVEITVGSVRALVMCIFIEPALTYKQRLYFCARNLTKYCQEPMPMIVLGNFNVDIMKDENFKFIAFMRKYLYLDLASNSSEATSLGGSCVDLIFVRNVHLDSKKYNSYALNHRPILSLFDF